MRLSLLTAGAALLLCQSAAINQTNTTPSANDPTAAPAANATTNAPTSLRSHLRDSLQKAGFSDIKVVPSSFVISAKDKDGNPVFMELLRDFSPKVSELGGKSSKSASGLEDPAAASSGSEFVSVANNDELSSKLIGLDIYNSSKQDIGQIRDIAIS